MSRDSYSVYHVLSAGLQKQIVVTDLLHDMLICWADTDPSIATYTVGGPRLRFFDPKGNERVTRVPLVTTSRVGQVQHWDTTWSTNGADESLASQVKQAHAQDVGAAYRLFGRSVFESNRIETKNRKSAQRYLYAGNGVATEAAECQSLMALVDGPQPISKLGLILGRSDAFASLVVLRLWLIGRVVLPMTSSLMQPNWVVARRDCVE